MSLSALTIASSRGIQGRAFSSAISGKSAGSSIDVLADGTPGFSVSNGVLHHENLPYPINTAVLVETLPGTGTRTTRLPITAPSVDNAAMVAEGGTVSVTNSAGAQAHDATADVDGTALDVVSLAATVAMIDDGVPLVLPVTGIYVDTITPTVAAGVVTGFVLS